MIAALVMWILTVGAGLYLLVRLLADGGLRRQGTKVTRYPAAVLLGHPMLGAFALAAWLLYLWTGRVGYAWSAFGLLVVVAFLGFTLLTRWLPGHGGRHARGVRFPKVALTAHGVMAIGTFVLVFLAAIR